MRVLFHTYDLAFARLGGGERVMLALAEHLGHLGCHVEIFDPWRHDPVSFDLVHYFSARQSEYWPFHHQNFPAKPLVVTPTLSSRPPAGLRAQLRAFLHERKLKPRFACPNLFFPVGNIEAERLNQLGVERERIRVLPNGIEPAVCKGDANIFWQKLGRAPRERVVLCVGRFDGVKNQRLLVEAAATLENVCVVFVGAADPEDPTLILDCQSRAAQIQRRHPGVEFLFLEEVEAASPLLAGAYAAAHVYVQPSQFETFGLAALEARLAGCNMAVTEGAAVPELFPGAKFFSPTSVSACAQAIAAALAVPRARPAPATELERFSWPGIARQLHAHYEELLGV